MQTKSGFIAIVGRPNVGKSSLMNALVGEKIAIVSDKPQTTRNRITGVLTRGETQLVFLDTPGVHKSRTKLGDYMNRQVTSSVADVDLIVFVTEANRPLNEAEKKLIASFRGMPAVAVLNKIDLLDAPEEMLRKIAEVAGAYEFDEIVPVSVLKNDGLDGLLEILLRYAEEGPHFFEDDAMTDQPERVIVAEIIREKILRNMRDEIPHGTAVTIERMQDRGRIIDIVSGRLTRACSSARRVRCSSASVPRPGKMPNGSWAPRSTSSAGSRSRRTGATGKASSKTSAMWMNKPGLA